MRTTSDHRFAVPARTARLLVAALAVGVIAATAAAQVAAPARPAPAKQAPASAPRAQQQPAPAPAAATPAPAAANPAPAPAGDDAPGSSLDQARLTLGKWIETQQIISKERNDWAQGKEILQGRIELVGKEVSVLKERITQSESAVAESDKKKQELTAQNDALKTTAAQLNDAVAGMEGQIRKLAKQMPEPIATKLQPLLQRMPAEGAPSRVSTAERFQNVLGILNELNRANSEITVAYEIRTLADGTSSEVQVIDVGLAQAYYISPRGEAGIGRPSEDGWKWAPAPEAAASILLALEIIQGKHSPSFVPVPIDIR
jgi:phage shock protein A